MPSDLDGELLKAILEESTLPRAVRGVASRLVEELEATVSGENLAFPSSRNSGVRLMSRSGRCVANFVDRLSVSHSVSQSVKSTSKTGWSVMQT